MKQFIFEIKPMGKPRQTRSDKWKQRPCVMKYRSFSDELRLLAKKAEYKLAEKIDGIFFEIEMPKTWSKKKKAEYLGKPHKQVPDIDNLLKSVFDVLAKDSNLKDDCEIWSIGQTQKTWGNAGKITIFQKETLRFIPKESIL